MTQIYTVSSGEYSDYRINVIVRTEHDAKKIIKRINEEDGYGSPFIETYDLVSYNDLTFIDTIHLSAKLYHDVEAWEEDEERVDVSYLIKKAHPPLVVSWQQRFSPVRHYSPRAYTSLQVYGTDHERVRKTFSDRKAEILANPQVWTAPYSNGKWKQPEKLSTHKSQEN